MPDIHPSAILQGEVDLADDVSIGLGCVLDGTLGPIRVGPGTKLVGRAWLNGPLTIGARNLVYPNVCLGFAPQSLRYDPQTPGCGTVIGDDNVLREGVTVHRAMTDDGPTTIGNRNWFMCNSHVGHDARVGDGCIFANGALLGGHVVVDDNVNIGGNTPVHQFVHIGRGAMLSGGVATTGDLPPYFMLTGFNAAGSLNVIGMRRLGLTSDEIDDVRWVYRTLYRHGLPLPAALQTLRGRAERPSVALYIQFIETSKRPLVRGHVQARRDLATGAAEPENVSG